MTINQRTILTVAELNAEVNLLLSQGFPLLWVEGEISNLVRPASGHLYFSLKDQQSQIRCAMFRNRNMKLRIKPENGMKILLRGRVGLYEPRGEFQLIAEHMEDAGIGKLQREYEALKQKLADAGLFDEAHKKELPEYPQCIGVITSPTGAAIQDILNVLKRRSPHTRVLIYPVSVQGESAKIEIESAIRRADMDQYCDVIILARGGGSLEDLWSFNDENVAKAIYHANTPIVSGIGHEIDFTIADFVADLRAPTPSAAAELVTADKQQLLTDVIQNTLWMTTKIRQFIQQKEQRLDWLSARLERQEPVAKIFQNFQRLDELESRLQRQIKRVLENKQTTLNYYQNQLLSNAPTQTITKFEQGLNYTKDRHIQAMQRVLQNRRAHVALLMAKLDSVSPLKTLDRGFAIIKNATSNDLITSNKQIYPEMPIKIQLKDGESYATINRK